MRVLIACDGITYGGRDLPRLAVVGELRAALPSVTQLLVHDHLGTLAPARAAGLDALDCESSGVVRRAFAALGHDAVSCDLLPAEDGETS